MSLIKFIARVKFVDILRKLIYQILFFSIVVFAISGLKTSDLLSLQLGITYIVLLFVLGLLSRLLIFVYYKRLHIKRS